MKGLPRLLYHRWQHHLLTLALLLFVSLFVAVAQVPSIKIDEKKTAQLSAMIHRSFPQKISILHLGDSHLQAGFLPEAIRTTLAQELPLEGPGLVIPYELARTNGPRSYQIQSSVKWNSEKLFIKRPPLQVGVSGMILSKADNSPYTFTISSNARPFDQLIVYRTPSTPSLVPSIGSATLIVGQKKIGNFVADTLLYPTEQRRIFLRNEQTPTQGATYGGFVLLKKKQSIEYHVIGINGAMFSTFTHEGFIHQTSWIHPTHIVLSFGTNEAQAREISRSGFEQQVMQLIRLLRKQHPKATFLLTTPPPSFRRNRAYNDQIEVISEVLHQIAVRENLELFDMYEALGCEEGAYNRRQEGDYYAYDGVHFSAYGYTHQGQLIGKALLDLLQ